MAVSVICEGCAHRFPVPEGHARRKIRCPECGVMCPVPEGKQSDTAKEGAAREEPLSPFDAPETSPGPDLDDLASELWKEPEPPVPERSEQVAKAPRGARPRRAGRVPEPVEPPREPASKRNARWDEEDEDGSPYAMAGGPVRKCPECNRELADDAVVCVACGLDLRGGKRVRQEYQPIQRTWDPGWPLQRRWRFFLTVCGISFVLMVTGAVSKGNWFAFAGPWVGLVAILSFLLGTFLRIDLERNRRGRVKLERTWYIFFIRQPPQSIDVRDHEGIAISQTTDSGCWEWAVAHCLFSFAISVSMLAGGAFLVGWIKLILVVPALIPPGLWWWFVMRPTKSAVALTRDHGYADVILYRGANKKHAWDLATVLREASHLRCEQL